MMLETIGLVGLGFLGRSIAACLIGRGLTVKAYARRGREAYDEARPHVAGQVRELVELGGFPRAILDDWADRLIETQELEELSDCDFVIESIAEDLAAKQTLFDRLEEIIGPDVPVGSNTSAIPIGLIQGPRQRPERFIGLHWSEPAHNTRFLEIIPGDNTSQATAEAALALGRRCGKEPSVLKKDIRGFVTNRLFYAMVREAFHLLESGVADAETIDRSFRNDVGWWATLAGPFRLMDLTGLPAYAAVMKGLFPELSKQEAVPETMRKLMDEGANGVFNGRGFYDYTPEEAERWQAAWGDFSWDIRKLAEKYTALAAPANDE